MGGFSGTRMLHFSDPDPVKISNKVSEAEYIKFTSLSQQREAVTGGVKFSLSLILNFLRVAKEGIHLSLLVRKLRSYIFGSARQQDVAAQINSSEKCYRGRAAGRRQSPLALL